MSREYVERRLAEIGHRPRRRSRPKNMVPHSPLPSIRISPRYTGRIPKFLVLSQPLPEWKPHPDAWIAPEVELLSIERILLLPEIDSSAHRPGVYFLLFDKDLLVYVGSSRDVRARVAEHDRALMKRAKRMVRFDAARYLPVPHPWQLALEALYIRHYQPEANGLLCDR